MTLKGKFNVGIIALETDDLVADVSHLAVYMAGRIRYLQDWMESSIRPKGIHEQATTCVKELRAKLQEMRVPTHPIQVKVAGTFFPAILLHSGWWERRYGEAAAKPSDWHDDLQSWLFTGFEQWGPSWDIGAKEGTAGEEYFFGQLGSGDEVNSLPVIIPTEKAAAIHESRHEGQPVFEAEVTAFLIHRTQIFKQAPALRDKLSNWGKPFDYCLLLSNEEPRHKLAPMPRRADTEMYSGYLWQCFIPRKWLKTHQAQGINAVTIDPPSLKDVYFLWEHTDFTRPDAVAYNIDSLRHKERYLEQKHGELVLLQKSSELVTGEPILSHRMFYDYLVR